MCCYERCFPYLNRADATYKFFDIRLYLKVLHKNSGFGDGELGVIG